MSFIDPLTVPITLERFKTITDSKGQFTTWTDIIKKAKEGLPVNLEILGTVLKGTTEVIGDNVVLDNISNKNVMLFNDNLLLYNNKMTQDKWIMYLYDDFMLNMEYSIIDERSAADWSRILSEEVATMYQARNDFTNLQTLWEVQALSIALGNVKLIPEGNAQPPVVGGKYDYSAYKELAKRIKNFVNKLARTRTAHSKGFDLNELRTIIGQDLATNLLMAKTAESAAPQAFDQFEKEWQPYEMLGHIYRATLYLEQDVEMSEYTNADNQVINTGVNTGQQIRPYQFGNTAAMVVFIRSLLVYGHTFPNFTLPVANSRTQKVETFIWRMNVGINPIFAKFNYTFFYTIPVFKSYIEYTTNKTIPAYDMSKAADFNNFVNSMFVKQPMLYKAFFNGQSALTQDQVDAIWTEAIIPWKPTTTYFVKKGELQKKVN